MQERLEKFIDAINKASEELDRKRKEELELTNKELLQEKVSELVEKFKMGD